MSVLGAILIGLHLFGMALVIGAFFANMRAKDRFPTAIVLVGAIIQVVSGALLAWLSISGGRDTDHVKLAVHGVIGLAVLVSAIAAQLAKSRHGRIKPWFHSAGGLAFVNLLVAVFWRQYS